MSKAGFMKDAVILFVITLVSGCLLGGVYQVTKEPIAQATIAANNKAYKAVFNEAETFESDDALTAAIEGCNADLAGMDFGGVAVENVLKAVDGSGNELGYVITSLSNDSYHISRLCMKDAVADGFPAVRDLNKLSACLFNTSADIRNDIFYFLIAGIICCNDTQICHLSADLSHGITAVLRTVSTAAEHTYQTFWLIIPECG